MTAIFQFIPATTGPERFEAFQSEMPLVVTRARRGFGGFITLDLGAPVDPDAVTGEPQWQWHLWIYTCDWDLQKNGERILWRRESDTAYANRALERLQGEHLVSVDFADKDDCFIFRFTGGFNLHVDPNFFGYDAQDDMFMLFKHGERDVLSYSPARRFYKAA